MMRLDDMPEVPRHRRDPLLGDVLRDLVVTTAGFLLAIIAVILSVNVFSAH